MPAPVPDEKRAWFKRDLNAGRGPARQSQSPPNSAVLKQRYNHGYLIGTAKRQLTEFQTSV
jgi:hypothetical protein